MKFAHELAGERLLRGVSELGAKIQWNKVFEATTATAILDCLSMNGTFLTMEWSHIEAGNKAWGLTRFIKIKIREKGLGTS